MRIGCGRSFGVPTSGHLACASSCGYCLARSCARPRHFGCLSGCCLKRTNRRCPHCSRSAGSRGCAGHLAGVPRHLASTCSCFHRESFRLRSRGRCPQPPSSLGFLSFDIVQTCYHVSCAPSTAHRSTCRELGSLKIACCLCPLHSSSRLRGHLC